MEDDVFVDAIAFLQAPLTVLMLAMEIERDMREYVRSEHSDFLETRFRTFEEYMYISRELSARKTQVRYDYPLACGFLDGKHIAILKLAHAGNAYFNYKQFHSIVFLAISDCDHNIIAFDIGAPGRIGDAGIFRRSTIKVWPCFSNIFSDNDDVFPPTRELGSVGAVQYHFLVDDGFGQDFRYVRPYRQQENYNESKARFNKFKLFNGYQIFHTYRCSIYDSSEV
ncbi:hypothetical protein ANCCAN_10684 [Ancylostoma caninum]|uniref:DDE Tnp4 domain-containing protein n=1 Tax=Ancylostoma caninum TaxID=29170 RepID=A0A368GJV9_ANCCA|nr:hypothetical protein ANCCAN_10684 [Ancylostoma caninum]